jgi:hypothetical protein
MIFRSRMRVLCSGLLMLTLGCASTVTRLDGEFPAPIGPAKNDCEKSEWLVVAPTRAEFVEPSGKHAEPRDDGVALYRVGAKRPESIPALAGEMGHESPTFADHADIVRSYDTRTYSAAGLGAAGLIAIGVGTALFVSSFKTQSITQSDGTPGSEQKIDGTEAGIGGGLVLAGFGLGIVGLALNPGQAERSRAEAARYVFFPPKDPRENVVTWTQTYNQAVRDRCGRTPSP